MAFNLINKLLPFSPFNLKTNPDIPWLDQPNAQAQLEQKFKQKSLINRLINFYLIG